MSKESSPREGITGNTYIDLGATTGEAYEISARSRSLARKVLGDEGYEDRIRQRCSIAVGDFSMADLIRFRHDPVNSGLEALARSAPVIADIRMVQVGIQKTGHDSPVLCALDYGSDIAKARDITRTSAGMIALADRIDGSIVVIGNAPSALLAVCGMIREGKRPALVIGSAVGFVNAAESKEELVALDVPSISVEGTRGGTPVAVAALNEIITIFSELQGREPGSH
ncbi:MAG TPA: precorrin-8X methylmutase [Methanoregulaceae archaeon]|nr:precorrin-8X methylmutase [Methanolinea sp.]MDD3090090.1 precorrin-8X methylmutase [Methanoregulaceae archaeon]MDD5685517.1 precorrin-8X methylmutase [Methanoregulaceae archaeon]HOP66568.1 precorrin-8X methylmutase [Methanoregulaceae archaeon]HPJ73317.1 precorrin-8X methylmutase [Methanoregulaceae archaeon]